MRTLLLMRHAKSDWGAPALSDFDRPLNTRGERDARRMGQWLQQQGLRPRAVLCSSALRTRQTLDGLRRHVDIDDTAVQFDERLYLASLSTLLTVLAESASVSSPLLLIGHNPGVEELLMHLCGTDLPLTDTGKLMTTATLAQIALSDDGRQLGARSGTLQQLVRARALNY